MIVAGMICIFILLKDRLSGPFQSEIKKMQTTSVDMTELLSGAGSTGGLNLHAAFGIPKDAAAYHQSLLNLTLESEDEEEMYSALEYTQREIVGKNGEGEHSVSVTIDGYRLNGGVYFKKYEMLLQRADESSPMIVYTLDSSDANAMKDLSPMERYQICLLPELPVDGLDPDWKTTMKPVTALLDSHASELISRTEDVSVGDMVFAVDIQTLTLQGEEAGEMLHLLFDGWSRDYRCTNLLCMNDAMTWKEETDTMERIRLLTEETEDASLSFSVGRMKNQPALLDVVYTCDSGEFNLNLLLQADGVSSVRMQFPEGDGFAYLDVTGDGENTTSHTFYHMDGSVIAESLLETDLSKVGSEYQSEIRYTFTMHDSDGGREEILSTATYTYTDRGGELIGAFEGELTSSGSDETERYSFRGELTLNDAYGTPEIPEIIEDSCVRVDSCEELYRELSTSGEDGGKAEMEKFRQSPRLAQTLEANMLLFMSGFNTGFE